MFGSFDLPEVTPFEHTITYQVRPCEVSGHQEHWTGWFHRWCDIDGKPHAIVEDNRGSISYVEAFKVRFTDRE